MNPKYKMVTWQMAWKVLVGGDPDCLNITETHKKHYEDIANKLNKLIDERCPYCEEGKRGCHCWNDE
jgi:hypothetical protein